MENIRDIVNGARLPAFTNKQISISGLVVDVASNGITFNLMASDNIIVPIKLRKPLDRPLEGYVEVHGTSQGKTVLATNLISFSNSDFDAKGHNALCSYLYSVPNLWERKDSSRVMDDSVV